MSEETPDPQAPNRPWTWCRDPARASVVGRFFAAPAGPSYISHSELQFGRASAIGRWSEDLEARIAAEARTAIGGDAEGDLVGMRCALAETRGAIAGLAFTRFVTDAAMPFAVLEDLLIDPVRRGEGLGSQLLDWLAEQCRLRGAAGCSLKADWATLPPAIFSNGTVSPRHPS